mgnify:CR=1 FL=1
MEDTVDIKLKIKLQGEKIMKKILLLFTVICSIQLFSCQVQVYMPNTLINFGKNEFNISNVGKSSVSNCRNFKRGNKITKINMGLDSFYSAIQNGNESRGTYIMSTGYSTLFATPVKNSKSKRVTRWNGTPYLTFYARNISIQGNTLYLK